MKLRWAWVKQRRLESIATSSPVTGCGEQPPQPDRGVAVQDEVAGPVGGDRAVPGTTAGSSRPGVPSGARRASVGEEQVDLDRHRSAVVCPVTRSTSVSAMICPGSGVAGGDLGAGVRVERGEGRDTLDQREQSGQAGHGVRRRAQADPALFLGVAAPLGGAVRVEPVRDPRGLGRHPPIAQFLQPRGEFPVDMARCSRDSHAVSRATIMARHSVVTPGLQRRRVPGSSVVRMRAQPR